MASGAPLSGGAPLTVTFDATGSSDPDPGAALTYFWKFGDGTPETATTNLTIQHTYTTEGVFIASLRARDQNFAFSAPVALQVDSHTSLDFFTLPAPCRIADTRNPPGPYGSPALSNGVLRNFTVWGVCGVPSSARSIAVNVTVAEASTNGFLTLFPAGQAEPFVSTINYIAGRTRANNAIVKLSSDGRVTVGCHMSTGTVHFILDVIGYFE